MLALTRHVGERILLKSGDIMLGTIEVVKIQGRCVKLAFELTKEIDIIREEIDGKPKK